MQIPAAINWISKGSATILMETLLILSNKYYRSGSTSVDPFVEDFYANILLFTAIR